MSVSNSNVAFVEKSKSNFEDKTKIKKKVKSPWEIDNDQLSADGSPAPKWKVWYARFMLIWAVLSNAFLLLQLIKIYTDKDAQGVSIAAYAVYVFGCAVWITYGAAVLAQCNWVIIVNSAIACVLAIIILVGSIIYQ